MEILRLCKHLWFSNTHTQKSQANLYFEILFFFDNDKDKTLILTQVQKQITNEHKRKKKTTTSDHGSGVLTFQF